MELIIKMASAAQSDVPPNFEEKFRQIIDKLQDGDMMSSVSAETLEDPAMWQTPEYLQKLLDACPPSPGDPDPLANETSETYLELVVGIKKGGRWVDLAYDGDTRWLDDLSLLMVFGADFVAGVRANLNRSRQNYFEKYSFKYYECNVLEEWEKSPTLRNEMRVKRLALHVCLMFPSARLVVPAKRKEGPYDTAKYVLERMLKPLQKSKSTMSAEKIVAAAAKKIADFRREHGEDQTAAARAAEETVKLWLCAAGAGESEKITAEQLCRVIAECEKMLY